MALSSKSKLFRAYALSELPLLFPYTHLSAERLNYFYLKIKRIRDIKIVELEKVRKEWSSPDGDAPPMDDDKFTFMRCGFIKKSIAHYMLQRTPKELA